MPFDPTQPFETLAPAATRPRFDPNLPFEPLGNVHDSTVGAPAMMQSDDNLARAAKDFYAMQAAGLMRIPVDQSQLPAAARQERTLNFPASPTDPIVHIMPEWTPEQLADLRQRVEGAVQLDKALGTGTEHLEAAVQSVRKIGEGQAVAKTVNFFTSPAGLATFGLGAAPGAVKTAAGVLFTAYAVKQTPELVNRLEEELSKPAGQRDEETVGELWTALGLNTGMAAAGAVGALRGVRGGKGVETAPAAETTPAQTQAAMEALLNKMPDKPQMVTPPASNVAQSAAGETPAARPARPPKASVPETPPEPERELTAVQETRASGASTVGQVQEYWRRKTGVILNREGARAILKKAQAPPPTDENLPARGGASAAATEEGPTAAQPSSGGNGPGTPPVAASSASAPAVPLAEAVAERPTVPTADTRAARLSEFLRRIKSASTGEELDAIQQEVDAATEKGELSMAGQNVATMSSFARGKALPAPDETSPGPAAPTAAAVPETAAPIPLPSPEKPSEPAAAPEPGQVAAMGGRKPVRRPSTAELTRPPDLIDHVLDNIGPIDPKLIKRADPNWQPIGAAAGLFRSGGMAADTALEALAREGLFGGDPGQVGELGEALNRAARGRKGWRTAVAKERRAEANLPPPSGKAGVEKTPYRASQGPSLAAEPGKSGISTGETPVAPSAAGEPARPPRVSAMGTAAPRAAMDPAMRAKRTAETRIRETEEGPAGPASELPAAGKDLQQAQQAAAAEQGLLHKAFGWLDAPEANAPKRAMQLILRARMGQIYGALRQADFAMRKFRKDFDRTPVARGWQYVEGQPLPRNYEVQRAIDTGELDGLTTGERAFAGVARKLLDQAVEAVQEVSPNSLRDLYENYFPRIWQKASADKMAAWLRRRPLEGSKAFLKQRTLGDWEDGLRAGLVPLYDNPVDMLQAKLGEMYQFAATRRAFADLKAQGLRKFVYGGEEPPMGWRAVDDPSSTVWAPPTVTVREAFDAQVRAKGIEFLQSLGIPHERTVKLRGKRWGEAHEGVGPERQGEIIKTKFGGPDFVIWHEAGHVLDYRYPDLRQMIPLANAPKGLEAIPNELRVLADLRHEGQDVSTGFKRYVRTGPEKMANIIDAYVRAPQRFGEVAPTVWKQFRAWLNQHPEVKGPLNEIRPSLTLGSGETELWVGHRPLGKWYVPEPAARILENYLSMGIGSKKWYGSLRAMNGLFTSMRLFGFFHGGMVTNDAQYATLGLALNDVLTGHPVRAAAELAKAPAMVVRAFRMGGKIKRAIDDPATADAVSQELAKAALEVNLRSHTGTFDRSMPRAFTRALREAVQSPSTGAAWEAFWRAPFALAAKVMEPVMEGLVPRLKFGMHGMQAVRILADNPEAEPMQLRNLLAKSADSVEDRLGQVTYDNLFMHRAVKDSGQLALTAFGWHLTKYRGVLGTGLDIARAAKAVASGKKPEMTYRMTYLPAMVIGHALIGGMIHYALTGRRPKGIDYIFPETGYYDAYGRPVRLAIADYVKDLARDVQAYRQDGVKGVVQEQTGRLAATWNMAAEMYRNQDFWGTRIFSDRQFDEPELQHLVKVIGEGVRYVGGSSQPFSVTAAQKLQDVHMPPALAHLLPYVGVVPASRAVTMTPAEAKASEAMQALLPRGARAPDAAAHSKLVGELVRDIRTGKVNSEGVFEQRARAAGVKDRAELTRIQERVRWTPLQYQVMKLPLTQAMDVFDLGTEAERTSLAPFLAQKIQRAYDGGRLDDETARRYVAVVKPWYGKAAAATAAAAKQPKRATAFAR